MMRLSPRHRFCRWTGNAKPAIRFGWKPQWTCIILHWANTCRPHKVEMTCACAKEQDLLEPHYVHCMQMKDFHCHLYQKWMTKMQHAGVFSTLVCLTWRFRSNWEMRVDWDPIFSQVAVTLWKWPPASREPPTKSTQIHHKKHQKRFKPPKYWLSPNDQSSFCWSLQWPGLKALMLEAEAKPPARNVPRPEKRDRKNLEWK